MHYILPFINWVVISSVIIMCTSWYIMLWYLYFTPRQIHQFDIIASFSVYLLNQLQHINMRFIRDVYICIFVNISQHKGGELMKWQECRTRNFVFHKHFNVYLNNINHRILDRSMLYLYKINHKFLVYTNITAQHMPVWNFKTGTGLC